MEKKYNKADYYFGSKPVLERAEDENEFEGSLTTSPELTDLAFIHELPSAFWRSIWLGFVNKGKIEVVRPDAEDGEIGFIPTYQFEASRPKQIWDSPIWRMSGELAKFQGGWPGWEDVEFFSVFEVIGFEDLKSAVESFIAAHSYANSLYFSFRLSEMQHDPADLVHIRTWKDLWATACNNRRHEITRPHSADGPEQVVCFTLNYNRKLWFAKKERVFYVIWTGNY